MTIRLTQLDGELPNMALMKLSHYFKSGGHTVKFEPSTTSSIFEPEYDLVLGCALRIHIIGRGAKYFISIRRKNKKKFAFEAVA